MCRQPRPWSDSADALSDQGLGCPVTESFVPCTVIRSSLRSCDTHRQTIIEPPRKETVSWMCLLRISNIFLLPNTLRVIHHLEKKLAFIRPMNFSLGPDIPVLVLLAPDQTHCFLSRSKHWSSDRPSARKLGARSLLRTGLVDNGLFGSHLCFTTVLLENGNRRTSLRNAPSSFRNVFWGLPERALSYTWLFCWNSLMTDWFYRRLRDISRPESPAFLIPIYATEWLLTVFYEP